MQKLLGILFRHYLIQYFRELLISFQAAQDDIVTNIVQVKSTFK